MKNMKIFVAGHRGLIGSALVRVLRNREYHNLILQSRSELDLTVSREVEEFIGHSKPDVIILAAAKVGGIVANLTYPYEFLIENLKIQNNVIAAAHKQDVPYFIFLGSSCIYPKFCEQPIRENYLLQGDLEPTNRPYAIAKIAGLELINSLRIEYGRKYLTVMPTNLFGPNDNYSETTSHVVPGLIRRFHEAVKAGSNEVVIWGSGEPLRELMYSEDCADAIVHLMEFLISSDLTLKMKKASIGHINIGSGHEISIKQLAQIIADIFEFKGRLIFDRSKPDGTPRKILDCSYLKSTGWQNKQELRDRLASTVRLFRLSN
jgi:GDP-L-fucose synthase